MKHLCPKQQYSRSLRSAAVDLRSQTEFGMTSGAHLHCLIHFSLDKRVEMFSTQFELL